MFMRGEIQPLKYQEIMGNRRPSVAIADTMTRPSFERLLVNNATPWDRERIQKHSYWSHWGIEPKLPTPIRRGSKFRRIVSSEIPHADYFRHYARSYERIMRKVSRLQAKLNTSDSDTITHTWYSRTKGKEEKMIINQPYIDALVKIASGIRMTLYDHGFQSVVNKVHEDLGVTQSQDENTLQIVVEVQQGNVDYDT